MRSRLLLRPSWLLLHLLVVVVLVLMVRLGFWQWGRGVETDSLRNYSYGLEWWAFAALSLVGYVKICWDETAPDTDEPAPAEPVAVQQVAAVDPVDAEDDPELAAWNARLAELARRDAERR